MINGKSIALNELPSKGFGYANKDFEIFVNPLTIKEEMATSLERLGASKSSYFENLMDSIEIRGNFDKKELLYIDIQYIDLGRRLFSFELDEEIRVDDNIHCNKCGKSFSFSFMFNEVSFNDLDEKNFGKELQFSDGLRVKIKPVSMRRFLKITREYLTNSGNDVSNLTNFLYAYRASSVYEVFDTKENEKREFKSLDDLTKFMFKYLSDLYKFKDSKVLTELDESIASTVNPLQKICSCCGEVQEVVIEPHYRFQQ